MKAINYKELIFIPVFFFLSLSISAQPENILKENYSEIVPNHTELKIIHSKIIDDDFYLYIKLPNDYKESSKTYPVIYLLDGDIAFTMAWSIVRYLQYGRHVPDVIIVGIGYGSLLSSSEQNMRERDYSISRLEGRSFGGGGEDYLNFLKAELIPFIDSNYRTKPGVRILNGYSLGGLFTLYTFLKQNELFSGYVAGSPYISNDKEELLQLEKNARDVLKSSDTNLFISYGELEDKNFYVNPIDQFVEKLISSSYDGIRIDKHVFEGGSHFTCPSEALTYGLISVFK